MTTQIAETISAEKVPLQAKRPHRVTTDAGVHVLLTHYAWTRDTRVRDAVTAYHQKLVRSLASRFRSGAEPFEDLVQIGTIGLIRAIDRYDPARGLSFSAYAAPFILGEIKHHFRDCTWQVKVPRWLQERLLCVHRAEQILQARLGSAPTPAQIADELGVTEENVLEAMEIGFSTRVVSLDRPLDSGEEDVSLMDRLGEQDAAILDLEACADLRRAMSCLNPREGEILRLRFFDDLSQFAVAERLGLSQMHVSRLQQRALHRLRGMLCDEPERLSQI